MMSGQPIVCQIDAIPPGERERHAEVNARWQGAIEEIVEQAEGYAFRLPSTADMLLTVAEFISRERLCCPFFRFEIVVEQDDGPLWLHLTGGQNVKAFIAQNLPYRETKSNW